MTKERAFITGLVSFLVVGTLLATGSTDGVYIAVSIAFFLFCVAYAVWCEKI